MLIKLISRFLCSLCEFTSIKINTLEFLSKTKYVVNSVQEKLEIDINLSILLGVELTKIFLMIMLISLVFYPLKN